MIPRTSEPNNVWSEELKFIDPDSGHRFEIETMFWTYVRGSLTCLVVMHPVEHNLWGPVPPGGHVASHLILGGPRQPEVEDLELAVLVHSDVRGLKVPAKRKLES